MRFVIAAALFVLSVVALLVGLAERTIWAPAPTIAKTITLETQTPYLVIPTETLRLAAGNPKVTATGSDKVFIAYGRQTDVEAWVGDNTRGIISFDAQSGELFEEVVTAGRDLASPVGSDLWRYEQSGDQTATLAVSVEDESGVLIASDGQADAPTQVQLVWPVDHDLYWSNFWLITGAVLLTAAMILNLIAYRIQRRNRGPRRRTPAPPKPPRYRVKRKPSQAPVRGRRSAKRRMVAFVGGISMLSLLAGCTPNPQATESASPSPSASAIEVAPAVITSAQLTRIVGQVSQVVAEADEVSDKKLLTPRVAGPAFSLRSAHYVLRSKSTSIEALPAIAAAPISFSLPAASTSWPRTVMAVTDAEGEETYPQMLVLQQESPRTNYKMIYNIRLIPGAEIPEVPATELGAIPVESSSLFLKLPPIDLAASYGDVLNNGMASLNAGLFDLENDAYYQQVSKSQKDQVANLPDANITFAHALGDEKNVLSLSTSNSGALVAVYLTDIYTIKPKNRNSAVAVTGLEKILLGADGSTKGVRTLYGNMLLFYVPAVADESGIRLLGATQGLLSVRSL